MSRGGPFFNRPYNPGSMRGMRGSFRSSRPFNPNWRGRGRGGLVNQQIHPHYYEEDDEYTRCVTIFYFSYFGLIINIYLNI